MKWRCLLEATTSIRWRYVMSPCIGIRQRFYTVFVRDSSSLRVFSSYLQLKNLHCVGTHVANIIPLELFARPRVSRLLRLLIARHEVGDILYQSKYCAKNHPANKFSSSWGFLESTHDRTALCRRMDILLLYLLSTPIPQLPPSSLPIHHLHPSQNPARPPQTPSNPYHKSLTPALSKGPTISCEKTPSRSFSASRDCRSSSSTR